MNARLNEAAKLGFKTAIIPRRIRGGEAYPNGIQVIEARSLREALHFALVAGEGNDGNIGN
jgi:DNA repair protein RadA/Sms